MILIDHQATTKELLNVMIESAHSRFPIINNEQHKILGVILAKDLLGYFAIFIHYNRHM
jgi:magnesium and cobalt transporter